MIARFGEFEIDEGQSTLRRAGAPVAIQPKAFDVLLYLIKARGRVVQKRELLDSLWPDAVVGDHSVVRAISTARSALNDTSPYRFIRSYARRGYRFVAEVDTSAAARVPTTAAVPDPGELFVGRDSLIESLHKELVEALGGQLRVLLLEGEAGIGKTRTALELERIARSSGAQTYSGWCLENEPSAPFHPWIRVLSALSRTAVWQSVERAQPAAAAEVAALLRGGPVGRAPGAELALGDARLRLFDAIAAVLRAGAAEAPIVLLIDDLHAADPTSLRLVEFVARELADSKLALLMTLRSEEVFLQHPVLATLAELTRRSRLLRVTLQGLGHEDVRRCIAAWAQQAPRPDFVDDVFRRSEGNPFFVRELARWLSRGEALRAEGRGAESELPPSVRDVIRHRLQRRSVACVETLRLAAVVGQDFDVDLLLRTAGAASEGVLAALEEALTARLAKPSDDDPGRWRFTHTLIRETLLAENSALWVSRTHRSVAEALRAMDGEDEARLIERAHHACAGADVATADAAVACALRAANRALALTAFEEAARLCVSALRALALAPGGSLDRRIDVLLELGRSLALAGEIAKATETFSEARALADGLGDARRKLRAILGLLGNLPALAPPAPEHVGMLDAAIRELPAAERALRVTALSRLALACDALGDRPRAVETVEAAIAEAHEQGDARAVAATLALRATVSLPSEAPSQRLARVDEALRALASRESPRVELECRIQRAAALLELGDTAALQIESVAYARIAARLGHPTARWYAGVQKALQHTFAGDLEAAEQAAMEAWSAGSRAGHPDAGTYLAIQLTQLRYFQGRLAEMDEPLRRAVAKHPALSGLRAALSLVLVETGRTKEAQRELSALAQSRFAGLPRDAGWLSNLSLLALVAVSLRSARHACELETLLTPYAERNICAFVVASNGSASHFLGLLAHASGHSERALARLREAVAENRRMGLAPWTALSEQALAELLLQQNGRNAADRAEILALSALGAAERIGMRPLAAAARQTLKEAKRHYAGSPGRARAPDKR